LNRGKLSKIFGELITLIESDKRGSTHAIRLTYSESAAERFSVPENVYMIGLMNTAGACRAVADYVLRRRFAFFSLQPAFESRKFRQYFIDAGAPPELFDALKRAVGHLNQRITDDLGDRFSIGHGFFCPGPNDRVIDARWILNIVDGEIEPLLREYWGKRPKADVDAIIREFRTAVVDGSMAV
jgi:5-methylcytosine-specific restriction protein B